MVGIFGRQQSYKYHLPQAFRTIIRTNTWNCSPYPEAENFLNAIAERTQEKSLGLQGACRDDLCDSMLCYMGSLSDPVGSFYFPRNKHA